MASQPIARERWLAHLGRVLAVSEERRARLDADELAAIAAELGLGADDLAAAHKEAEDHLTRGQGFAARAMWTDAIAEFTEAHTLAPTRLDVSLALAQAHQRRGTSDDLPIADRLARLALEWEPSNALAFAILADLEADRRRGATGRLRTIVVVTAVAVALFVALVVKLAKEHVAPTQDSPEPATQAEPAPPEPAASPESAVATIPEPPPRIGRVDPECPRHAVFIHGHGCVAQDTEVVPGVGIGALELGVSTPADVLAAFGSDAQINTYDSGEIYQISYSYESPGVYNPSRRANWTRPEHFGFTRERLSAIAVGVYNRRLRTAGGLNAQTSGLDDALREFGDHYELDDRGDLDKYLWAKRGIEVWIDPESRKVNSFRLVPIERE